MFSSVVVGGYEGFYFVLCNAAAEWSRLRRGWWRRDRSNGHKRCGSSKRRNRCCDGGRSRCAPSTAAGAGLTIAIDSSSLVGSGDGLGFFSVGLNIPIWFKATIKPVSAVKMVATPPVMAGNVCHHCFGSSLIGETSVLHVDAYKWNRNVNCYMVISRFKVKSSVV